MKNQKFSIGVWSEHDDRGTYINLWNGTSLYDGLCLLIYKYRIMTKHSFCRVILLWEINPEKEAIGKLPKIIWSFGNRSIHIFNRTS